MRDLARAELDRVGKLKPGHGKMEAYLFGEGDEYSAHVGGAIDYQHRLNEALSLFGRGSAGYYTGPMYGDRQGFGWDAMAGIRYDFD